jgi:hypothetical protein
MTQQFAHNVAPSPRHLSAPGVPAAAAGSFSGPEFERNARALVSLVELYANGIKASGNLPAGITVEDLTMLPVARLQQLYYAAALKSPTANAQPGADLGEFARYDPSSPMGHAANTSTMLDGEVLRLTSEVVRLVMGASQGALARYGVARLEALRDHLKAELAQPPA